MRSERVFLILWTLAVLAATSAFILHLALRVRSVELGYELGRGVCFGNSDPRTTSSSTN